MGDRIDGGVADRGGRPRRHASLGEDGVEKLSRYSGEARTRTRRGPDGPRQAGPVDREPPAVALPAGLADGLVGGQSDLADPAPDAGENEVAGRHAEDLVAILKIAPR
jgi:hypothetical protein